MKMVCVVKLVPDPRAVIKVLADGSGIDTAGVKYACDPFDEFGVELAVQIKEKRPEGHTITAASAGGASSAEALRHALAMGCDRAVHLHDDAIPAWDELNLARLLAALIRKTQPDADLIFCGKQNIDNDAGELGPALAEYLGMPHIGAVSKLERGAEGPAFRAHRRIEGAEEIFDATLPALVTIDKGVVEPRRPALARLMKVKTQPIETLKPAQLGVESVAGPARRPRLASPPPRPACTMIPGEPAEMARELVRRLRDEAKVV
jgi:electron transfer flavoprotein beta subunit